MGQHRPGTPERAGAVGWRQIDEMLRVADVLVISAALTIATEGLIGARELGLMKENAT